MLSSIIFGIVIGLNTMTPGAAVNTGAELQYCDGLTVSASVTMNGANGEAAVFGANAESGGLNNSLILSGYNSLNGVNLIAPYAGRAVQGAGWDLGHFQILNWDQGGSSKFECAPTIVDQGPNWLRIEQFDAATFGDGVPHVRSEQDLTVTEVDRTILCGGTPCVQIEPLWGFVGTPDAINSFACDTTSLVFDADLSAPGNQTTGCNDLSVSLLQWTSHFYAKDFPFAAYYAKGTWNFQTLTTTNLNYRIGSNSTAYKYTDGTKIKLHGSFTQFPGDNYLFCLASSTDAQTAVFICPRFALSGPDSVLNVNQTHIVSGSTETPKNWMIDGYYRALTVKVPKADCTASRLVGGLCYLSKIMFFSDTSAVFAPSDTWQATSARGVMFVCNGGQACLDGVAAWSTHTGDEAF